MTRIDIESKRKLREMGATALLEAIEGQDDTLTLGMSFEERIQILIDEAHSSFTCRRRLNNDPVASDEC